MSAYQHTNTYEKKAEENKLKKDRKRDNQPKFMSLLVEKSLNIDETTPIFASATIVSGNSQIMNHESIQTKLDNPLERDVCIPDIPKVPASWSVMVSLPAPEGYRMAKTLVDVRLTDEISVESVANKIFYSNKQRSVQAYYNDEYAIAICKTRSFTTFHIRIFQGHENNILIELQRRSGCCLAFKEEYQALLQVLKGDSIPQVPIRCKLDLDNLASLGEELIPLRGGVIEASLELAMENMSSDIYCTRLLALEDLIASTDPEFSDIAQEACHLILQKYTDIFKLVLSIICIIDDKNDMDDVSFERFHCLALTLLRNISILTRNEETFISMMQSVDVLHSLLRDIQMAAKFPWNACLATRSLSIICVNSPNAMAEVGERVRIALENAKVIGKIWYYSLEVEAEEALSSMVQM